MCDEEERIEVETGVGGFPLELGAGVRDHFVRPQAK
jgi:hypothetical protein